MTRRIEELFWPDADLTGPWTGPESDLLTEARPLTGDDALTEAQLLDVRVDAMRSRVGVLLDLRGGLWFVDGDIDVALLVLDGVRTVSWTAECRPRGRTAWTVMGWRPEPGADGITLWCGCDPDAELLVRSVRAAFVVGATGNADLAPPDYGDDDEETVRAGTPTWSTPVEPRAAVFWSPAGPAPAAGEPGDETSHPTGRGNRQEVPAMSGTTGQPPPEPGPAGPGPGTPGPSGPGQFGQGQYGPPASGSGAGPAAYDAPVQRSGRPPRPVTAVRVLLFVVAGFTALLIIGGFIVAAGDARAMGAVVGAALPGLVALVLAILLPRRGRVLWWCVFVLQILSILIALGVLGQGDPRGLTNLLLPVAILVLVVQRSSRDWFARRGPHA